MCRKLGIESGLSKVMCKRLIGTTPPVPALVKSEAVVVNRLAHLAGDLRQKLDEGSRTSLSAASKRQKFISVFFFPLVHVMDLKKLLKVYSFKTETSYCFIGGTVVLSFFTGGEIICEFSDYIIKNSGGI